jgi:hypothetical protein
LAKGNAITHLCQATEHGEKTPAKRGDQFLHELIEFCKIPSLAADTQAVRGARDFPHRAMECRELHPHDLDSPRAVKNSVAFRPGCRECDAEEYSLSEVDFWEAEFQVAPIQAGLA